MTWSSDITMIGNLTRDPELRFTNSGMAVCNFTVAVSRKQRDEEKTAFVDVTCFREMAENVAESLTKGSRVIVNGQIDQDSWDDRETGQKRTKLKVLADDVGPSLRWASAEVQRNERRDGDYQPSRSSNSGGGPSQGGGPAFDPDEEPF
jgi:single-strand DNA-binding protein